MLDIEPEFAHYLLTDLDEQSLTSFNGRRAVAPPLLHNYAGMCARQQPQRAAWMIEQHALYFGIEIGGSYQRACNKYKDALPTIQEIDSELDNVLLAQERALEAGFTNPGMAVDLTNGLTIYWRHRSIPTDTLLKWLNAALNLSRLTQQRGQEASLLRDIGAAQSSGEEMGAALDYYEQALTIFKQIGDKIGQAYTLKAIGDAQFFRKEMSAVRAAYLEALTLFTEAWDYRGRANTQKAIGDVMSFRKNMDLALLYYNDALTLYKQIDDKVGQANTLKFIGEIKSSRKETNAAIASYNEALALYKQIGDKLGLASTLDALGDLHSSREDKGAALDSYNEALALYRNIGITLGQANTLMSIADITNDADKYEEAIRLYEQLGHKYNIGHGKTFYGLMLMNSGDTERGVKLLKEGREAWAAINHQSGVQWIDEMLADDEKNEDVELNYWWSR
jgi:tetratricopeptide (TPR) repeat protein